jgi:ABC-type nitrate/sulfonate/bicarbonate transport system substrate-binding protein
MTDYFAAHGVPQSKYHFVNLPPASLFAAFKTGEIDGTETDPPVSTQMLAAGGHLLKTNYIPAYVVFSTKFIAQQPGVVQTFVCDMAKAQQRFQTDPKATYATLGKALSISAAVAETTLPPSAMAPRDQASLPAWSLSSSAPVQNVRTIAANMKSAGLIATVPSVQAVKSLFDSQFATGVVSGKCAQ